MFFFVLGSVGIWMREKKKEGRRSRRESWLVMALIRADPTDE